MTALAFGLNAYRRNTGPFSETRCVNQYVEIGPDKLPRLIGRPGLVEQYNLGSPILGMFAQPGCFAGSLFAVAANSLWRDGQLAGSLSAFNRVSMAGSELELLIATSLSMFRYNGAGVFPVTFPDDSGETDVVYFAGLFVVARTGTQKFYWSAVLDGATWDSLSFASAERKPDNLVGLRIVGDELWMFGENTTEFWVATGDGTQPFQRIEGRVYDKGAINRDAIVNFDNSVCWVGQDRIVYTGGPTPQRISDFGIEERLGRTPDADIHAWAFAWNGHLFYCLNTSDGTFAYDAATQEWQEFKSWNRSGWRAHLGCMVESTVYAGGDTDGTVWTLSSDALLDGTDPIERVASAIVRHTGSSLPLNSVHLDITPGQATVLSGQGANPEAEIRLSRDGGKTFGNWRACAIGAQGEYRARAFITRWGLIDEPGGVLEVRTTDPSPWVLSGIRVNELASGRSR